MKLLAINCCYYPTTLAMVDDSYSFLINMRLKLINTVVTRLYTDPNAALQELTTLDNLESFENTIVSLNTNEEQDDEPASMKLLNVKLSDIYKQIYNPQRFATVSVVVADFKMASMDGIELCTKLKDSLLRKIMLTGQASYQIAVAAFNNEIINKFIIKDSSATFEQLTQFIILEQHEYFNKISKIALKTLMFNTTYLKSLKFIEIFNQVYRAANACEYYILDSSPSFIFLDKQGNPTFLLVKSEQELEHYYQIAKANGACFTILSLLKKREKLLFLFTPDDYLLAPNDWHDKFYPATKIVDTPSFYFAVVKTNIADVDFSKVVPYETYLKHNS